MGERMSKENKAQPRIFRAGLSDSELVVFLRDVAKKLETRELIIESPGRLRAKADAIEDELVRMKSDIDLFVVGYFDVT
ncbi:hypothetical protein CS369_02695 [Candidatus Symbiopectobacterium sp. 'North America']|nr:hypothetical protein [Candidatus Symbiopectobacterium sp. 'North America']